MIDPSHPKAFTIEYDGLVSALETQCGVCEAYDPTAPDARHPAVQQYNTIWDTGAMRSVISTSVVRRLKLKPTGMTKIFHANGASVVHTYSVNILLPNNVFFSSLPVTEGPVNDTDVLIGMDIISRGDFSITAANNRTKFSFQIPSTHDIDYLREGKRPIQR